MNVTVFAEKQLMIDTYWTVTAKKCAWKCVNLASCLAAKSGWAQICQDIELEAGARYSIRCSPN